MLTTLLATLDVSSQQRFKIHLQSAFMRDRRSISIRLLLPGFHRCHTDIAEAVSASLTMRTTESIHLSQVSLDVVSGIGFEESKQSSHNSLQITRLILDASFPLPAT
jgi:hypothetical protein